MSPESPPSFNSGRDIPRWLTNLSYDETSQSDVVVITAGVPRKPGMSRDDLLEINTTIVKAVAEQAAKQSPDAVLIVVTNPLDAMVYVAWRASGFPTRRVYRLTTPARAMVLSSSKSRAFAIAS